MGPDLETGDLVYRFLSRRVSHAAATASFMEGFVDEGRGRQSWAWRGQPVVPSPVTMMVASVDVAKLVMLNDPSPGRYRSPWC